MTAPTAGEPVTPPPECPKCHRPLNLGNSPNIEECHAGDDDDDRQCELSAEIYRLKHARPPAPSCPTEQGAVEVLQEIVTLAQENWSSKEYFQSNPQKHVVVYRIWQMARAALSRQPAPSGERDHNSGIDANTAAHVIDVAHARIASLEQELRAASDDQAAMAMQLRELRAAPSAVAKDSTINGLRVILSYLTSIHAHPYVKDLTDAISLLSQPAVAQTEAGNDMTARETKEVTEAAFGRWSLLQSRTSRPDCASFKAGVDWSRRVGIAAASTPALSESSPKSPSVPAVAGGGEDAARWRLVEPMVRRMDECITMANRNGDLISLADIAVEHRDEIKEACADVIDAAIAATKAKEGV